jgi:predicted RNA-binding protein
MNNARYWIASISKKHTELGVSGGFIQVCHGKQAPLKRMKKGDYILVYSSKITMEGNEKYQMFTAIGEVIDEEVYQFQMSEDFKPFRRNINFFKSEDVAINPLICELAFISDKKHWGYPFRFGFFEINKNDFNLIASKMLKKINNE